MLGDVFLAGAVRTPIGSFNGGLSSVPAAKLGAHVAKAALNRAGFAPDQVDQVIFGNVLSAGLGQNVARQVAIHAGLPDTVPATTVNKVCGSGLKAVMLAAQAIQCGDADVIVAGGTECMSQAPYLLPKARQGYRMGHGQLIDALIHDGLWDVYNDTHMGVCGDACAEKYQITRQDQDDFAVGSYQRAIAAIDDGSMAEQIQPIEVDQGKAGKILMDTDEEPGRFNEAKLRGLKPAFAKDGTVTAGNASSINDGAAAVVVLSPRMVEKLSLAPQAKILGYCEKARAPEWFTLAPIDAMEYLLASLHWAADDVDLYEINEAFSAVTLAAIKHLKLDRDKVNVLGGAAALGHPIGASGARTLVTLIHAMRQRQAQRGVDALCIGGGEAVAMAIQAL